MSESSSSSAASSTIPSPSLTPSPASASDLPPSLSNRINAATRAAHTQLNRLILTRLPLALPPHELNPSTYTTGLLHIAPIYQTFESLWQAILDAPRLPTSIKEALEGESEGLDAEIPESPFSMNDEKEPSSGKRVCPRTQALLSHLHLQALLRTNRLRADIRQLSGIPDHKLTATFANLAAKRKLSAQCILAEFTAHTARSIEKNPHVLVAYAWVFYMALFSGGRYLRQSLLEAGPEFWAATARLKFAGDDDDQHKSSILKSPTAPVSSSRRPRPRLAGAKTDSHVRTVDANPGLQFFHFAGPADGEDIKLDFKKRVTEAEALLTDGEKQDIIDEAQEIFRYMLELVGELDRMCGNDDYDDTETAQPVTRRALGRGRDSVFVAHDRMEKKHRPLVRTQTKMPQGNMAEALLNEPVTKSVRFSETLSNGMEYVTKPLGRTFSRLGTMAGPSQQVGGAQDERQRLVQAALLALVVLIGVLAWYLKV